MKVLTAIALIAVLAGCGSPAPSTVGQSGGATPSSTPTAACPLVEGRPVPEGCVGYDPDAGMRANEGYRQRHELPVEHRAAAEAHRDTIAGALRDALGAGPLTPERVIETLRPLGYDSVQSYGASDVGGGLAIGVSTGSGCVVGGVRGTEVTLEVGSGIADGGCLPAPGH